MNAWSTIVAAPVPHYGAPEAVDPNEPELKARFAEALLRRPHDAFGAACAILGNDTMRALRVSQAWPLDLEVLAVQADLLEKFGPDEFLPTKQEVARRIYNVGETAADAKDKLAAYKLYAEVRGFIQKADNVNNVVVNNNRVMVLRDFGTDEQWETKAASQQAKLIEHSRD